MDQSLIAHFVKHYGGLSAGVAGPLLMVIELGLEFALYFQEALLHHVTADFELTLLQILLQLLVG